MTIMPDVGAALNPAMFRPEQVAALAHIGGWTGEPQIVTATAIALAESGGVQRRSAKANRNGTHDWGVWQINDVHKPSDAVKNDAIANAREAYIVWVKAGHSFKPWSTYNSGSYKAHLGTAKKAYDVIHKDTSIEKALLSGNVKTDAGGTNESGFPNPLTAIPNAISGSVNQLASTVNRAALNIGALTVGIVLFILGVIIVLRGPASKVLSTATPIGKAAKVTSAITK